MGDSPERLEDEGVRDLLVALKEEVRRNQEHVVGKRMHPFVRIANHGNDLE